LKDGIGIVHYFYSEDSFILRNIKLREGHNLGVYKNASLTSASEKLDTEGRYLAMTIVLFHDIGRFEILMPGCGCQG
jgi:hypothetical protein